MQGFAIPKEAQGKVVKFSFHGQPAELKHGSVVIAAITSCTNTSNPTVMLGAALVAKKACEHGLQVRHCHIFLICKHGYNYYILRLLGTLICHPSMFFRILLDNLQCQTFVEFLHGVKEQIKMC